jgi:hypothetical protein
VWRLTWKTTEDGVIQYKWQKTDKTDRDEIRKAGEGQWVDITEQDAAAYAKDLYDRVDTDLRRRQQLFNLMDITNAVQSVIGTVASAFLSSAIFSGLGSKAQPNVPTGPRVPPPAIPLTAASV